MIYDDETFKPKVLIIGCGLAGLSLAAILERAEIPYEMFEKAKELRPLGSAISVGPGVMPMFAQLGVVDMVQAKGKLLTESFMTNDKLEVVTHLDYHTEAVERYGWPSYIISRPALQEILLGLIPPPKIHLNKRVLSFCETGDGVMIRTSDNKTHYGNILVGADGAYSGVRQCMYEKMDKEGKLPSIDKKPFKYSTICLVGQTRRLDEEEYPEINDEACRYEGVVCDDKPLCAVTFTTADKTVCWMVFEILDRESLEMNDNFRSTEWGPEAAESMCNQVRNLRLRENLVLGDLIDKTPKNVICKVMLEEKIFRTWMYGRTVLIGDACHKMSPTAGLGAQCAMNDAVILANHLNTIQTNEFRDVKKALKAYWKERYPHGKKDVGGSAVMSSYVKNDLYGRLLRKVMHNMPLKLWHLVRDDVSAYRPQISFLPLAEDKGTKGPTKQPSLKTTRPAGMVERE
ncbi:hypothetical protein B0O80DRAFT_524417 [Mortierella sp. GBAus27b]|nr:hypothetical protein BGX31_001020 [Mortierella sp. GBA43]KAI8362012.1 hypothetical protein B0O80DRAFT_524417 [Mortierella sp. GBAus27b]